MYVGIEQLAVVAVVQVVDLHDRVWMFERGVDVVERVVDLVVREFVAVFDR